jgi:hypothetical protein
VSRSLKTSRLKVGRDWLVHFMVALWLNYCRITLVNGVLTMGKWYFQHDLTIKHGDLTNI